MIEKEWGGGGEETPRKFRKTRRIKSHTLNFEFNISKIVKNC